MSIREESMLNYESLRTLAHEAEKAFRQSARTDRFVTGADWEDALAARSRAFRNLMDALVRKQHD